MKEVFNFSKYYNNIALVDDKGKQLTFKQLDDCGKELYNVINKRTLAFILCTNTIPSLIAYTSFINNGVVSILLSAKIEKDLLQNLIDVYQPEYIWTPSVRTNEFNFDEVYSYDDYSLLYTKFDTPKMNDDLCLLVTTSGSTGSQKFVRQSYENVRSDAIQNTIDVGMSDDTYRSITTLPMNYTYCICIINTALICGSRVLLTDKTISQQEFWDFFKKEGATDFEAVPFMYEVLDSINFYEMDLPSIRFMTQSGGKFSVEAHKKVATYAKERGIRFYTEYGATETTGTMTALPYKLSLDKLGSIGIAVPDGEMYLIDDDGNVIDTPNTEGEITFKGPNVSLGYASTREDLAKGDERNGVYESGDIGTFDEDKCFYITGRKKRFLKIFGHRVSLDEIDLLVKKEFNIDFVAGGVDNCIYLFMTDSKHENEIKKYLSSKTKLSIIAFKTVIIDEIPKNESGKIMFKELEKYYG